MVLKQGTTSAGAAAAAHRIVVVFLLLLLQLAFFHAFAYDPLNGNKAACNPNCPAPGGPYSHGCQNIYQCQH
ncbi:hypothetical protein OsJ_35849 [Oryza sativa Japonica Group]|jgi:hypothetical protein|uniref:Uncharacterized protein n=6 Tax=Oryza TaxID=4527 RepID=A0A8J8YHU4_ORYSJ|nr:hypothetical protein LOC_Os12g21760 [Oryza sativa Japonica Group]EAZ20246.1 hypothetical protein OsJ_35849 [Oryza sativa Japonica Group]KAF2907522.1 hypothetical protein DAI22_12g104000 [Oryza sativa Japonica Group]